MESIRGVVGFVKTVAAGSFAGAARELGVTPVAVSQNVQRLERQLGVRLLRRSTRKLSLTDEGRAFYERCLGPLQELESAHLDARDKAAAPAGVLRVTCVSPFGRSYVVPLLATFSRRYPAIEIDLNLDDAVSDMVAGGFDVGIRAGQLRDGTLIARPIAPLYFVVCAAPAYLARAGVPSSPADLARHNCLRLRDGAGRGANWRLGSATESVAPPVKGNFIANDMTTLVTAALHGHGLVHAPLPFVLPLLRGGALVPVLTEWVAHGAELFIHYPSRRNLPARVRTFVDFLLEHLRRNPDLTTEPQTLLAPFMAARVTPSR